MKYTRINIREDNNLNEIKWIIRFIIIIPVIALIAGKMISYFFIVPSIQGTTNYTPTKTINTYDTAYMVQAGVFMSKDNADVIVKAMQGNNYKPVCVTYDNEFRVIIDNTYDIKMAETIKDKLKSNGYDCIISKILMEEDSDKKSENTEIKQNIKDLIKLVSLQMYIKDKGNNDDQNIAKELTNYETKVKKEYDNIKKANSSFNNDYLKIVDSFNGYEKSFKDNINSKNTETYNTYISQELLTVKKMIDYCDNSKK